MKTAVSFGCTKGSHQLTAGVWLQRFQSNETLALSQYGQATFTSLQTLLQGVASSLLYDPAPTEMGWRAWFGAWYLQDAIHIGSRLNLTPRFSRRIEFGMERESTTGPNTFIQTASSQLSRKSETRRSR